MTRYPFASAGTSTQIMNMTNSSRSNTSTASTLSTIFNPIKKSLNLKKRLSNKRGTNALFRAISAENWELVCTIADSKPYKAEAWHKALGFFDAHRSSKILPLHQACIFHPSKDAIIHIIQAYPVALRSRESGYNRVPLHIACHSNASLECVQALVEHYPEASIEHDIIGRVPLHYALSNGASYDIVKTLIDGAKEVAGHDGLRLVCSVADFNGWLPIHVACFMGASAEVLAIIVHAYPDGVDAITKKKSTPRGLLKGISIGADKRAALDSILTNRGITQNTARVFPARTNMEKVVRMSDETCSKGVTLELDEDETSSLSSIETSTRTGSNKHKIKKRMISEQYQLMDPMMSLAMTYSRSSSRIPPSQQLPTHAIYDEAQHINYGQAYINTDPSLSLNRTKINGAPVRRKVSSLRSITSNNSNGSTDDEMDSQAVFEPIDLTAAFC